jgi:hypothetical protein
LLSATCAAPLDPRQQPLVGVLNPPSCRQPAAAQMERRQVEGTVAQAHDGMECRHNLVARQHRGKAQQAGKTWIRAPRDAVKCDRIHARGAAQAQASRPHAAGPLHGVKVVIPTPIQLSQSYLSFSFRLYHKLIINFTFMLFVQLVPQLLTPHICMLLKDKNNL